MKLDDTSPFPLACVWFGAAVSMAEISTGAILADAPGAIGMAANLAGHLLGAVFLFAAAWISWRRSENAIEVCGASFGAAGPRLFGALNFVQLVGWTAVMVIIGARSMDAVASAALGIHSILAWRLLIGILVLVIALAGFGRTGAAGVISVIALACLCLLLTAVVFMPGLLPWLSAGPGASAAALSDPAPPMPFGEALELAVVMPLSWLPLVGDYVKGAKKGRRSCLASAAAYTLGGLWMYSLGLYSMRLRGNADPVSLLGGALALPALAVVLLATVTTAFLDARSAGISLSAALPRAKSSVGILAAGLLGLGLALVAPMEEYETFLGFIGSVFAPLYAVIFADAALSRVVRSPVARRSAFEASAAFGSWAAGVALYALLSSRGTLLGASIPVMVAVSLTYSLIMIGGLKWKSCRASQA